MRCAVAAALLLTAGQGGWQAAEIQHVPKAEIRHRCSNPKTLLWLLLDVCKGKAMSALEMASLFLFSDFLDVLDLG